MDHTHPEGLAIEPHGAGFGTDVEVFDTYRLPTLLTQANIDAVRKNHGKEWDAAREALPPRVRAKSGRREGLTDDERDRLATLAVLIEHHMFPNDDGSIVVEEREEVRT